MFQPFLFWGTFGNLFANKSPSIDAILSNSDFTIEDLLENEGLLQDVQNDNQPLIEVLTKVESLCALVKYVTEDPVEEEDADQEKQLRLRRTAAKLLSSGHMTIANILAEQHDLVGRMIDRLYAYCRDPPLSESITAETTLSVLISLLDRSGDKVIRVVMERPDTLNVLLQRFEDAEVAKFFLKFFSSIECRPEVMEWIESTQIIISLLDLLKQSTDSEVCTNVFCILSELVKFPELNKLLCSEESASTFFSIISDSFGSSVLSYERSFELTFLFLIGLLKQGSAGAFASAETVPRESLPPIFKYVLNHLDTLEKVLKGRDPDEVIETPTGQIEAFGVVRLKIMEMIHALVVSNYESVCTVLIDADVFNLGMELFLYYRANNFLHAAIATIVRDALRLVPCKSLQLHVLKSVCPRRIMQLIADCKSRQDDPKSSQPAYRGHLFQIAEIVHDKLSHIPEKVVERHFSDQASWIKSMKEEVGNYRARKGILAKMLSSNRGLLEYETSPSSSEESENEFISGGGDDLPPIEESADSDASILPILPPLLDVDSIEEKSGVQTLSSAPDRLDVDAADDGEADPSELANLERELTDMQISLDGVEMREQEREK